MESLLPLLRRGWSGLESGWSFKHLAHFAMAEVLKGPAGTQALPVLATAKQKLSELVPEGQRLTRAVVPCKR